MATSVVVCEKSPASPTLEERIGGLPLEIRHHILRQFDDAHFGEKLAPWLAEDDPRTLFERARGSMDLDVSFERDDPRDVADLVRFLVSTESAGRVELRLWRWRPFVHSKMVKSTFTRDFCRKSDGRWKWWKVFLDAFPMIVSCRCGKCRAVFSTMRSLNIQPQLSDDAAAWKKALAFRKISYIPNALQYLKKFPADMVSRVYMAIMLSPPAESKWDTELYYDSDLFLHLMAFAPLVPAPLKDAFRFAVNLFFVKSGGDSHTTWGEDFNYMVFRLKAFAEVLRLPYEIPVEGPPVFSVKNVLRQKYLRYDSSIHLVVWMAAHLADAEAEENVRFYHTFEKRDEIEAMPAGEEKCALLWQHGFYFSSGKWTWEDFFVDLLERESVHDKDLKTECKSYFTVPPTDDPEEEPFIPDDAPGMGQWAPYHWEMTPRLRAASLFIPEADR